MQVQYSLYLLYKVPLDLFSLFENKRRTVVMKNNHLEEYLHLVDEANGGYLLIKASHRFANMDRNKLLSSEDVMKELNITQEDLDNMDDVEIE